MIRYELGELATLLIGILALLIGRTVRQSVPVLRKIDMPNAVIGAMIIAIAGLIGQLMFHAEVVFGARTRDALLLRFFTSIGLSAKFSALLKGGKRLLILCLVTVLALIAQNVSGTVFALLWGTHPAYGVLAGSLSFVGGPGTAMAWAKESEATGLRGAQVVGVGAATLAVVVGALVSGPVAGWIVRAHKLRAETAQEAVVTFPMRLRPSHGGSTGEPYRTHPGDRLGDRPIGVSRRKNQHVRQGCRAPAARFPLGHDRRCADYQSRGSVQVSPGFRTNRHGRCGRLATFLGYRAMATPLISVAQIIVPLTINVIIQVLVTVAVAYFLLFRLLGKDYDAAVTAGGFLGFGLSSMPVAMATMDEIAKRYGPSPKAFLLITLAGSFFVDLANAFIAKGFLVLPLYAIRPSVPLASDWVWLGAPT